MHANAEKHKSKLKDQDIVRENLKSNGSNPKYVMISTVQLLIIIVITNITINTENMVTMDNMAIMLKEII